MRKLVLIPLLLVACERSFLHDIPNREPATPPETTCAPDGSPSGLGTVASETGVTLSFTDTASNEEGFVVERRGATTEAWVELARLGPNAGEYIDRDIQNDRTLYYRVKAYRIVNDQWCESLPVDSPPTFTLPNAPTELRAGEVVDNTQILLLWTDTNQLESGYILERRPMGEGAYVTVAELPADTARYTDPGRTPGAVYEYQLSAVNASGRSRPALATVRASAAPQLSWIGSPWLEPGTCHLVAPGMATYDQVLGAVYASASGTVSKASGLVIASEGGLEATLDDLVPGPFTLEWSVEDSLGSRGTLSRSLSLDAHASAQTVAPPRAPTGVLGDDYLVGRQATLPGCANCTGRRGSLATTFASSCSLDADGLVECWGWNARGYLGNGESGAEHEFAEPCADASCAAPLRQVTSAAISESHACAILSNGEARCWSGYGFDGELGNGDFESSTGTPVPVCASGRVSDETCVRRTNFKTTGPQALSLGEDFGCGLTTTGTTTQVVCWGANDDGVMGNGQRGSGTEQALALEVCETGSHAGGDCVPLTGVASVEVSTGEQFACARMESGRVRCWGDNYYDYLGVGGPDALPSPYNWPNAEHEVCATGAVDRGDCVPLEGVLKVVVGIYNACALTQEGRVRCWGYANSAMGAADDELYTAPNPADVCASGTFDDGTWACDDGSGQDSAIVGALDLGMGDGHGCVIIGVNREVHCWGGNGSGQLGDGTYTARTHPAPVCLTGNIEDGDCVPLVGASRLRVRYDHGCVDVSGTTYCWGRDVYGELGHGNDEDGYQPNPVPMCASGTRESCVARAGVLEVALGEAASCILTDDPTVDGHSLACTGRNYEAQLGRGDYARRLTAGKVCAAGSKWACQPLDRVVALASGDRHTCAVREDSTLWCFGYNGAGQLGLGEHDYQDGRIRPVPVCAAGVLGLAGCRDADVPSELRGVVAAAGGMHHTCALLEGGAVRCFGLNNCGQLGNGRAGNCLAPNPNTDQYQDSALSGYVLETLPVQLCSSGGDTAPCQEFSERAVSVAAGQLHSCVLLETGTAKCFGRNDVGQLGSGEPTPLHANPVPVCESGTGSGCPALSGIVQLSLGNRHSCALLADGTARCWGENARGQLGDGTTTSPRIHPVPVCRSGFGSSCEALSGIVAITSGDDFNCALLSSGEVRCWGNNQDVRRQSAVGTLGAGSSVPYSNLPMPVCATGSAATCELIPSCTAYLDDAVAVSAAETHVCAERADGSVVCWGEESTLALGIGELRGEDYCAPVRVCADGVDEDCPTPLAGQAVQRCDLLTVNVVGEN